MTNTQGASQQGSLSQFITNANTITGANAMRFVPAVPTNQSLGGQTWWRTSQTGASFVIGANTTVDGRASSAADASTQ